MPEFNLPAPKTRKEYFMAIAAGGVPGTDFPVRYESIKNVYNKYEETLEAGGTDIGYLYEATIEDFVEMSKDKIIDEPLVKINGKDALYNAESQLWANEDGYALYYGTEMIVGIESDTELTGDALNVIVEVSFNTALPLKPKTVEEAYFANLGDMLDLDDLASMKIKTRKDQYLNAMIADLDGGDADADGK